MKKWVLIIAAGIFFTAAYGQEQQERELVLEGQLISAILYHDNGEISQKGFYNLDGKPHGKWTAYNVLGDLTSVAEYNEGQKTGIWYIYNEDFLKEITYSDNKIVQVVTWKENERWAVD